MAIPLTILDAMVICGLDDTQLAGNRWEGRTKAEHMTGILQEGKLLDLDLEDEDFLADYKWVIDSELISQMEDTVDAGSYIGMELGIR
jgi:hypothetical protein